VYKLRVWGLRKARTVEIWHIACCGISLYVLTVQVSERNGKDCRKHEQVLNFPKTHCVVMLTPKLCRNTISTDTYPTACWNQKDRRTHRHIFHSVRSFYAVGTKGLTIKPAAVFSTVNLQVTYNMSSLSSSSSSSSRSFIYTTFATIITLNKETNISW
jgi:hypothetical protein